MVQMQLVVSTASIVNNLIKFGALALIARYGYLAIEALAGKTTLASIIVQFLASVKVTQGLAYVIGLSGCAYGAFQRRLRRTAIARIAARNTERELGIDPGRSSSGLTPRGETNPEDRL